jgi:hypothetical protein
MEDGLPVPSGDAWVVSIITKFVINQINATQEVACWFILREFLNFPSGRSVEERAMGEYYIWVLTVTPIKSTLIKSTLNAGCGCEYILTDSKCTG